jgi:peroxiredoxin
MTIKVGDKLPSIDVQYKTAGEVKTINTDELFGGKKVVLFALPGAFTPTCSASHLPGYVVNSDRLFEKGIDRIICLSVNDAHVMQAWGEDQNVEDRVMMIADGSAHFSRAVGLELDRDAVGMGIRSQRYAMVVNDGVVELLNIEAPGEFKGPSEFVDAAYNLKDEADMIEFYRKWAEDYDHQMLQELGYTSPTTIAQLLSEHLTDTRSSIFDIGCGTGLTCVYLADKGYDNLDGIDLSQDMVRVAGQRGIYRELLVGDVNQPLQRGDECYDAVTMSVRSRWTRYFAFSGPAGFLPVPCTTSCGNRWDSGPSSNHSSKAGSRNA